MSIPVFVDTFNLGYMTKVKHQHSRQVSYESLFDYFKLQYGNDLDITCYVQRTEKSDYFVRFLQMATGAFVKQRQMLDKRVNNFDVELAVDVLANVAEKMIICSASPNLTPLLQQLFIHRTMVHVHAIGIPQEYRDYCTATEFGPQAFTIREQILEPAATV